MLDLGGLDAILEHNPEDMTATVQAGVTAGALAARLAAHRQTLPLDPPGWASRTVGGIAATAASGPLRVRYGTMRDLLLGVRFIQADGVVTWGGAKVVKSVTGYDIPKLLVGSLGTLAVLGELTLRLHPLPEVEATGFVPLASVEAALGPGGEHRRLHPAAEPAGAARRRRAGGQPGCRRPPPVSSCRSAAWSPPCGRSRR